MDAHGATEDTSGADLEAPDGRRAERRGTRWHGGVERAHTAAGRVSGEAPWRQPRCPTDAWCQQCVQTSGCGTERRTGGQQRRRGW